MALSALNAPPLRRGWLALLLAGLLSLPAWGQVGEHELKAAFIGKFAQFVQWPERRGGEFRLCAIGRDPLQGALEKLVELTPIGGRPARFVEIGQPEQLAGCDMLFIGRSVADELEPIKRHAERATVLTIGDTPGFAARGVMINFVHQGGKIRFEINRQAARAAGLQISARLLKLAVATSALLPTGAGGGR